LPSFRKKNNPMTFSDSMEPVPYESEEGEVVESEYEEEVEEVEGSIVSPPRLLSPPPASVSRRPTTSKASASCTKGRKRAWERHPFPRSQQPHASVITLHHPKSAHPTILLPSKAEHRQNTRISSCPVPKFLA